MYKLALLCAVLGLGLAASSQKKCSDGCHLITELKISQGGKSKNLLHDLPHYLKKCDPRIAAPCKDNKVCMEFKPSLTADAKYGNFTGKMKMAKLTYMCLPALDAAKLDDVWCETISAYSFKSTFSKLGGQLTNIHTDCSEVALAPNANHSHAQGFCYSAFWLAVVFFLF